MVDAIAPGVLDWLLGVSVVFAAFLDIEPHLMRAKALMTWDFMGLLARTRSEAQHDVAHFWLAENPMHKPQLRCALLIPRP